MSNVFYTSQQKKQYKGLMLNIFYIEKKKSTQIVYFRFIWAQQIWQYQQKFSTSLSEHIMDRHKLSCSMEVC